MEIAVGMSGMMGQGGIAVWSFHWWRGGGIIENVLCAYSNVVVWDQNTKQGDW